MDDEVDALRAFMFFVRAMCIMLVAMMLHKMNKRIDVLEHQVRECVIKTEDTERRMDVQMDIFAGIIKDAKETW